MQLGPVARLAGKGLGRLKSRPIFVARGLHGKGGDYTPGGEGGSGPGVGSLLGGETNGVGRGSAPNPDWKAENTWRSPTPLFGGPGLLGGAGGAVPAPGVIRGYNSFVAKDGGEGGAAKGAAGAAAAGGDGGDAAGGATGGATGKGEGKAKEEEKKSKCCDHDHAGGHKHDHGDGKGGDKQAGAGAPATKLSQKSKREIPVVLQEEDEDDAFDITSHPVWNQESLAYLLENNRRWVAQKTAEDPEFFKKLASVHKPEFLFIGCSDARLSVQHMLGLEAGELFVHRNVANMVMHTDLNLLTVLTYAVDYLKVKHIIVCGHYDCGGVRAAMKNHDHGLIENWIMGVRDVARYHRKELKELDDDEAIHRRLVELNVQEQCVKLYANPVMQKSQAKTGFPHVHAMVFDVGLGLVKELDIDFKAIIRKYRHVYSMYNFNEPPTGLP